MVHDERFTAYPVFAFMAKDAISPAVTAAAALAAPQSTPPQPRAAALPVVLTPAPLVKRGNTVTLAAVVVGVSGDVPKLLVPPGIVLTSQPTSTIGVPVTVTNLVTEVLPHELVTE